MYLLNRLARRLKQRYAKVIILCSAIKETNQPHFINKIRATPEWSLLLLLGHFALS